MDQETLFTATKWDILKQLENGGLSPLELSKALGSSLANVSQQLRLLEMAGVVKTQRIGNRDKDKPRVVYSLAGNMSYLISTSDNFVDKKMLSLSETNKIILKIWFVEDKDARYALEKAFWQIEGELAKITKLCYAGVQKGMPVLSYSGNTLLPATIGVGGAYGTVRTVKTAKAEGVVLLERVQQ